MDERILRSRCACGWESTGTPAVVIAATIDHGKRIHNMDATPEQVLERAEVISVPDAPPAA